MSAGTHIRDPKDTIVAVASVDQPCESGIVRISGPETITILQKLLSCEQDRIWTATLNTAHRRPVTFPLSIASTSAAALIPAELYLWPNERTYTGQCSAELHVVGASVVLNSLLNRLLELGARPAGPGEFTLRAFLAGKLDLVQAEAVLGVIHADNPDQLSLGLKRLGGGLSTPLQSLRDELIHLLADLEAGLDFVEEDIEFVSNEKVVALLKKNLEQVRAVLLTASDRTEYQQRLTVCLVGPPNAGKSSLFNLLCHGYSDGRLTEGELSGAIVSSQAGTTRDFVSANIDDPAIPFVLVDTAGIEDLKDAASNEINEGSSIDQIAWQHSWQSVRSSDFILFCWPCDLGPEEADGGGAVPIGDVTNGDVPNGDVQVDAMEWLEKLPKDRTVVVRTKWDLRDPQEGDRPDPFSESRVLSFDQNDAGLLEVLRAEIQKQLAKRSGRHVDPDGLLGPRAADALRQIELALQSALENAEARVGDELIAMDLHEAIDQLGKLVGTIYTDDLLDSIFSRFCIGK